MNKILWYLTKKLDASFPSLFLFYFFRRTMLCISDMISMCAKIEKSGTVKRRGVMNTIILVLVPSCFPECHLWASSLGILEIVRHVETSSRLFESESAAEQDLQVIRVHAELGDTVRFIRGCLAYFPNS